MYDKVGEHLQLTFMLWDRDIGRSISAPMPESDDADLTFSGTDGPAGTGGGIGGGGAVG